MLKKNSLPVTQVVCVFDEKKNERKNHSRPHFFLLSSSSEDVVALRAKASSKRRQPKRDDDDGGGKNVEKMCGIRKKIFKLKESPHSLRRCMSLMNAKRVHLDVKNLIKKSEN